MNPYPLIHAALCYAPPGDRSANTDSRSHAVIAVPKAFHLEPAPALCKDLGYSSVQRKQSVSSILTLLPQEFSRVCSCFLADESLAKHKSLVTCCCWGRRSGHIFHNTV